MTRIALQFLIVSSIVFLFIGNITVSILSGVFALLLNYLASPTNKL